MSTQNSVKKMISPKLSKDTLVKKVKEAVFRNELEKNWMIDRIPEMETKKDRKELLKFLSDSAKELLKIKTPYDFSRVMESVQKGHPKMSQGLKSLLGSLTDQEIQKSF